MHASSCGQSVHSEKTVVCGEIVFKLDPEPSVINVTESMLSMMRADQSDKGWMESLKSNVSVFLPEEQISLFLDCCRMAEEKNLPIYFQHEFYDYHRWLVKAHGWIHYIPDSGEFHLIELRDKQFSLEIQRRMYGILSDLFDSVFEVSTGTNLVTPVAVNTVELSALNTTSTLEVFRNVFIDKLVHIESRESIKSFLDVQMLKNEKTPKSMEFRTVESEHWHKIFVAGCMDDKYFICISDITHEKQMIDMQKRLVTDRITNIMNRAGFELTCEAQFQHTEFDDTYNVLVLIELVGLYDYPLTEQEELVRKASQIIEATKEKNDVLARFREDAFILCMHGMNGKEEVRARIGNLSELLRQKVKQREITQFRIGYSKCNHNPDKKYHCAFDEAAQALHSASMDGRNNVVNFEDMNNVSYLKNVRRSVKIRTFGYFEVYVDGMPIQFKNRKAKELLAVLVDRKGGFLSNDEGISYLWPEEPSNKSTQARFRKAAMQMKNTLKEYGIEYIVEKSDRERRLITDFVDCDLLHYLNGDEEYVRLYDGTYMTNYSWSEYSIPGLNI